MPYLETICMALFGDMELLIFFISKDLILFASLHFSSTI